MSLHLGQARVSPATAFHSPEAFSMALAFPEAMPNAGVIHWVDHHQDPLTGEWVVSWIREE